MIGKVSSRSFWIARRLRNAVIPPENYSIPRWNNPRGTSENTRIVAQVYPAYDDSDVYLAAIVHEDQFRC
jgi:hypothetical protein